MMRKEKGEDQSVAVALTPARGTEHARMDIVWACMHAAAAAQCVHVT